MEDLLQVGAITQPHGVHGEVKVFPMTDDVRRFKKCKELVLDTGKEKINVEVESVKFFKQFVILKFKGYDDMDSVEKLRTKGLFVTRANAVKLKKDEYFIADLIGLQVLDEEEKELGTLVDVIETGANDVYSVKTNEGKEILFPAIKECILNVDMENRQMHVHVMPGLLDD